MYDVWTLQRNAQRERRAMLGMGKRKPALELALESFQDKEGKEGGAGEGKAVDRVNGGRVADGS